MNTKLTPKQYIDFNFKIMQDAINDIINGKKTDMVNLSFDDEIDFASDNNEIHIAENDVNNKIYATDILTDTSHRYISDVDLEKLNQSINKTELNATVKEITNNFKLALNDQIDNIINSGDDLALELKIADISDNYNAKRLSYLPLEKLIWFNSKYCKNIVKLKDERGKRKKKC